MPIQVLEAGPRKKTFGQKLGAGFQQALDIVAQDQERNQLAKSQMAQEQRKYAHELGLQEMKGQQALAGRKLAGENKNPLGGLTGQPIPKEVSNVMSQIVSQNPTANADELKMMMDETGIPPAFSGSFVENRRRQDERKAASTEKLKEMGQKRAEKTLNEADKIGKELPVAESSINAMEDAILNGDQSFWSPDSLAEITGVEAFRTAKGGQFKTAAKTFFINDLKSSGARPNQFIEKQFVDALAKVGRSEYANQTVIESFKFSHDLKKNWLDTVRNLEEKYYDDLGYMPGNFAGIVEKNMEPYIKERQKKYERRLKDIAVSEKKGQKLLPEGLSGRMIDVIGPDGNEYELDESEVEQLPPGFRIK
ncbi:MAG: hypothetical protein EHM34_02405 [Nitrosopumilales archaeon]|nr:MAG: hypothetical protein EHM34_02405 [Nitrosopumilales archaeon]